MGHIIPLGPPVAKTPSSITTRVSARICSSPMIQAVKVDISGHLAMPINVPVRLNIEINSTFSHIQRRFSPTIVNVSREYIRNNSTVYAEQFNDLDPEFKGW
jgi:hypothetical protein